MQQPAYYMHPIQRFVRSLGGDYLLRREAAAALQRSEKSLAYVAHRYPDLGPSYGVHWGKVLVKLYTPEDLRRLEAHFERPVKKGLRHGRPLTWTPEETNDRANRRAKVRYYLRRGRQLREEGRHEAAQVALDKAEAVMDGLSEQLSRRTAEMAAARSK